MRRACRVVVAVVALAPCAHAATFTVNDAAAVADALPGDGTCATATGTCTLLAAIQETEALAGADEIHLSGTFRELPDGETVVRDELRIVGPGSFGNTGWSASTALAVRGSGILTLEDVDVSLAALRASAVLDLVRCALAPDTLFVRTAIRVEPGGDLHVSASTFDISVGSTTPVPVQGIEMTGGRAELSGVVASVLSNSPSGVAFVVTSGGVLHAKGLEATLRQASALEIDGGDALVEQSALRWSTDNPGYGDSGWMIAAHAGSVALSSCTLECMTGGFGGSGVMAEAPATVTLSHCDIRHMRGTGVWSSGTLVLRDSTIADTSAASLGYRAWSIGGSGLRIAGGTAQVQRTAILRNAASAFTYNTATSVAGGGLLLSGGLVRIEDSRIVGNSALTAGSGLAYTDDPDVCMGGGIAVYGGTLLVDRCLVADNTVRGNGGGIAVVGGTTTLRNVTVSGCSATQGCWGTPPGETYGGHGGGISVRGGQLVLASATVTSCATPSLVDAGDGVEVATPGILRASGSLIAGNGVDCVGDLVSEGFNLVEDASLCAISGVPTGIMTGADPQLLALADNGGPTETHALAPGSVARDAGDPAGPSDGAGARLRVDQRNRPRITDGDGDGVALADLGAFEACEDAVDGDADGTGDRCDACPSVADDGSDADHDGVGDACDSGDTDRDGVADASDDCPAVAEAAQLDTDGDGMGDACDACPDVADDGADADGDGLGDACDPCPAAFGCADSDLDGVPDVLDACTDQDGDGFGDPGTAANTCPDDTCPLVSDPGQEDTDGDGAGDACDVCPGWPDPAQEDRDGDGFGDACDPCTDADLDGFGDGSLPASTCPPDNCVDIRNTTQDDHDTDGIGDACDACTDADGDGLGDPTLPANTCPDDNCPSIANPSQDDADTDGAGDPCDRCPGHDDGVDSDRDGVPDACDICPRDANPGQEDTDRDGHGDACDDCPTAFDPSQADMDGDGSGDACDPCPTSSSRVDIDRDGAPDACDTCPGLYDPAQADADDDGDGDLCDNCPFLGNPSQADTDRDGRGDACDPCPLDAGNTCRIDLLRCGATTSRSVGGYRSLLTPGGSPVLDATRDFWQADIISLPAVVIPGDAQPVGDGNPGVIVFYELTDTPGPLLVHKAGADVVVSGW